MGLPEPASDRAYATGNLWDGSWLAALAIGVFVWGLIIWAVVRYRRRSEDFVPSQTRYNLPIEVLYTVAPIIVVAVLFYFTLQTQSTVTAGAYQSTSELNSASAQSAADNSGRTHQIHVIAAKWNWTFVYTKDPALGGNTDVYDVGDPAHFTQLYLPVDEPVTFTLDSIDVVHAFWLPEFYFKLDVIPGKTNAFSMTPTRMGTFRGHCSELCGLYHSRMLFDVHIVSRADYEAHLRELEAAGNVGSPPLSAYSFTTAGTTEGGSG